MNGRVCTKGLSHFFKTQHIGPSCWDQNVVPKIQICVSFKKVL
jgi:hypothetical protein